MSTSEERVNLCSPRDVSQLLRIRGIHPSKALGQNFLVDRHVLEKIVASSGAGQGSRVVEVGAGLGVLTEALLDAGAVVTSVEKDETLWPLLEERFGNQPQFSLVKGDALELDWSRIFPERAEIMVANLPYSVGSRVVVDAATCPSPPQSMTLLLQKEVCERFAAPPRSPERGAVSVWLQRIYDVELVRDVPGSCFVPRPEVTSSILSLKRHGRNTLSADDAKRFVALSKAAFLHRRKQIASGMRSASDGLARPAEHIRKALEKIGASPTARPEELTVEQWMALAAIW